MRRPVRIISCAVCAMSFASAGSARAQASFARTRHDAQPARAAGAPTNIAIPLAHPMAFEPPSALLRLANLRTVTFAPDVTATLALSRRSVGLRFTIRM